MDYPMKEFHIEWCDSVNGLVCLAGIEKNNKSIRLTKARVTTCIWNPSIRKGKILPVMSTPVCYRSFKYGFGYDELHDEYKIVVIFRMFDDSKVKIYGLKTDYCWRTLSDFQEGSLINCSAKFVKGKLYWISTIVNKNNYYPGRKIVSFDLSNETWDQVEQPNYGEGKFNLMLGVLGSDLVVLCNYGRIHFDVWVMNDHGVEASWKKMFTISCPDDPRNNKFLYMSFSPLFCQSYKGEILLLYRSIFMIYNPKDASIRQTEVAELTGWFEAEIFIESLVNPLVGSRSGT